MLDRPVQLRLVHDRDHYEVVVDEAIRHAQVSLWIATANVKELHVEPSAGTRARARRRYVSILSVLGDLAERGVELRLLHGAPPSRPFREALPAVPTLADGGLELRLCPRVHFKMVAVDGRLLYLGSANLTGAGLGAKGDGRRNFESGIVTDDEGLLDAMQERFDQIWSGRECDGCRLRRSCPAPLDAG